MPPLKALLISPSFAVSSTPWAAGKSEGATPHSIGKLFRPGAKRSAKKCPPCSTTGTIGSLLPVPPFKIAMRFHASSLPSSPTLPWKLQTTKVHFWTIAIALNVSPQTHLRGLLRACMNSEELCGAVLHNFCSTRIYSPWVFPLGSKIDNVAATSFQAFWTSSNVRTSLQKRVLQIFTSWTNGRSACPKKMVFQRNVRYTLVLLLIMRSPLLIGEIQIGHWSIYWKSLDLLV